MHGRQPLGLQLSSIIAASYQSCSDLIQAIALALACLSYDFVGTSNDDSSEDLGTIQVGAVFMHMLCVFVIGELNFDPS